MLRDLDAIDARADALRERMYGRLLVDQARRGRQADLAAFGGSVAGDSRHSTPLDERGRPQADPIPIGRSPVRVDTVTLTISAGMHVDGTGEPLRFERIHPDPERLSGWDDTVEAGMPATQVECQISGRLELSAQWRWGFLRNGSGEADGSLGRFRCPASVRVSRTRAGATKTVDFTDPDVGPGGRFDHLAFAALKGDLWEVALLHDAGDDREVTGEVQWALTETETSADDAPPPGGGLWSLDSTFATAESLSADGTTLVQSYALPATPGYLEGATGMTVVDGDLWFVVDDELWQWTPGDAAAVLVASHGAASFYGLAYDGVDLWTWDETVELVKSLSTVDGTVLSTAADSTGIGTIQTMGLAWDATNGVLYGIDNSVPNLFVEFAADGTVAATTPFSSFTTTPGSGSGLVADGTNFLWVSGDLFTVPYAGGTPSSVSMPTLAGFYFGLTE